MIDLSRTRLSGHKIAKRFQICTVLTNFKLKVITKTVGGGLISSLRFWKTSLIKIKSNAFSQVIKCHQLILHPNKQLKLN